MSNLEITMIALAVNLEATLGIFILLQQQKGLIRRIEQDRSNLRLFHNMLTEAKLRYE